MQPTSVLHQSRNQDNPAKKLMNLDNNSIKYSSTDNITDSISNTKIINKENSYNTDKNTRDQHSNAHIMKNMFKKRKNHLSTESENAITNDHFIKDSYDDNTTIINKNLLNDKNPSKTTIPTNHFINNNEIIIPDNPSISSNSSPTLDLDTLNSGNNREVQESNDIINSSTSKVNISSSSIKMESSENNCKPYHESILLNNFNSSLNNIDKDKNDSLEDSTNYRNPQQNLLQVVNNNLETTNNNGYHSYNSSRRSSITIDSCKTMNNENEIENINNEDNNDEIKEKNNNNNIYENVTVISSPFESYVNDDSNQNNIIKDSISNDEIAHIKKSNKNSVGPLSDTNANNNNQNFLDLKLTKNDILNNNDILDLKNSVFLNDSNFPHLDSNRNNLNKKINLNNVLTINTSIVNLNKPNIKSPSYNTDVIYDHSRTSTSSSNENNNINEENREEKRSHSCSSINTILNSPNMKYGKTSDVVNNSPHKVYGQLHGNLINTSENKNNNLISKKAIIKNALKNNNVGLIYTKRASSMNNLNKLKLNINNTILFQTSSPKSAKSTLSNKSLDEPSIISPLLPNLKRKNGYLYNDLLLNHRSNSGKKEGVNNSLDIHHSKINGQNHNNLNGNGNSNSNNNSSSSSNNNSNNNNSSSNGYGNINFNSNIIANSNSNNININKIPQNFNINTSEDIIAFPSINKINDEVESNVGNIDINGHNQSDKSIDDETFNDSQLMDEKISLIKNWDFYKQFYRYLNLNDLTFKNKFIEQEYNKVLISLDEKFWKNDIPLECSFFCIIDIILNLFNDNLQSIKIQLLTILIPILIIFILIKLFHLNRRNKLMNFAIVLVFTLIGPFNYLISFFSKKITNTYLFILFTLNLIIWVFAGHFILHTNFKYTRYSMIICYLFCLIPFYYKLFYIDTKSLINSHPTSPPLLNNNNYTLFNPHNYFSSYPFISFTDSHLFSNYPLSSHEEFPIHSPLYNNKNNNNHDNNNNNDNNDNDNDSNNKNNKNNNNYNDNEVTTEEQYINILFDSKKINSSSKTIQQDKIIIQEIQDLINRGDSIYLYIDHSLIPLNPKKDDSLSKSKFCFQSNPSLDSKNKNLNRNNHEDSKNKKHYNLEEIIHDYILKSLNSVESSYQELKNKHLSFQKHSNQNLLSQKENFNKYELWVVVYESPSQPLKLNNFIIKYYYEKETEALYYLKRSQNRNGKENKNENKNKNKNKNKNDNNNSNNNSFDHKQFIDGSNDDPYQFITNRNKNIIYDINNNIKNNNNNNEEESIKDILLFFIKNFVTLESLVYVALLVSCSIVIKLKYELDLSHKLQYLTNCQYIQNNYNSILSLDSLQDDDLSYVADFASPIEKAIDIINQLLNQTDKESKNYGLLMNALDHLNSSNLLLPDLERQLQGFVELDDEQKQWLLYEIAQQNYNSYYDDSDNSSENSPTSISSPFAFYELSSFDILSLIDNHTLQLLERVKDYNFPIFEFCEATPRPLLTMSYHLFVKSGLIGRLHLNTEKFLNFIKEIEEGYHTDVTFHNACHITDILHCMYYFSTIPNISVNFKDWDLLFMFVAACIHDYDHPGLSNKFLIQTKDPLAILYNDRSVLENHHCAMSFNILLKENNNFLEHVDKEKFNEFREVIIGLVLATDLAEHFQILSLFKKKILNIPKCVQREDKILLMKILIKCADVSNATKEKSIYKRWVDGIMEEFYRQGDMEKKLNIPLSPFGNRDNANPNSCQKSFIEFIASPIFEALAEWVYTCQSKPDPEEFSKSPTKLDTHSSMSSMKLSSKRNSIGNTISNKRNSISNCNCCSNNNNANANVNTNDINNSNNISPIKLNKRSSISYIKITNDNDDINSSNLPSLNEINNLSNDNTNSNNYSNNDNINNNNNSDNNSNNNNYRKSKNLSLPSSPTLQERPLPGKKLSVGSLFKGDISNRLKSVSKYKESSFNLMIKRERDIESHRKMDIIMNRLHENRKWIENNGLGA
ncbi:hypothetical protein H8356DRAFT_1434063 [Neocallimastix lanati (nom. inval.)]|nr:hypothetical protein H8356DRAFT_1434063 [Neocallimastix sp. JGI-2020a]